MIILASYNSLLRGDLEARKWVTILVVVEVDVETRLLAVQVVV